jgi:hypothetical protein
MSRETKLQDQEFEQPFDSCPIDTPDNWSYRGLMNTGGHVYCRIWNHKTANMELMYNMLDNRVTIIGAKYHSESGSYEGDMGDVIAEKTTEGRVY